MLFIQLFAPALALLLGVGALGLLAVPAWAGRLRPLAHHVVAPRVDPARWSWLRVILTPSGHAFVVPRFETGAQDHVRTRLPLE